MGCPYGAAVAMATYMIYTTLFHKKYMCLGLCYNIKAVRHKYQSMPHISNLNVFQFLIAQNILECLKTPFTRPRGYKTFLMLSSTETKIYPAHKC